MKKLLLVLCFLLNLPFSKAQTWKLDWSEEFNYTGAPDSSKWKFELGAVRNNEAQIYTSDIKNAYVNGSNLVITAIRDPVQGYAYTSASITTQNKFTPTYGRFEMRAKIPTSEGTWPAWWTLGSNITDKGWPYCGEIDMLEFYQGVYLANVMNSTKQWSTTKNAPINITNWTNQYHTWVMDWDKSYIKLYLDDVLLNKYDLKDADTSSGYNPFRSPHYMILNLAIGGTQGGNPDATNFPQVMLVDYVRHYSQTPSGK